VTLIDLTAKFCFGKHFLLGALDWNTKSLKYLEEEKRSKALEMVESGLGSDILIGRLIVAIEESF
jgi:hypothetical protein